jgi:hypothetical protein
METNVSLIEIGNNVLETVWQVVKYLQDADDWMVHLGHINLACIGDDLHPTGFYVSHCTSGYTIGHQMHE